MERSISSQIIGILHAILRTFLGIFMMFIAVSTFMLTALMIVSGFWLSSKYGSPLEDPTAWALIVVAIGTAPSLVARLIVAIKNRSVSRNPYETLVAIINVTSCLFLYQYIFTNEGAATAVMFPAALIYGASAVVIILLGRERSATTPVIS